MLWFLVRLSKDYNINLRYQLEYRGLPLGTTLTGYSDSTLDLTLKIRGFEYFSQEYFRQEKRVLRISLRSARIRQWEDQLKGYILTRNLVKNLTEQVGYPVEIPSNAPDTLYFYFQRSKGSIRKLNPADSRTIEIKPEHDTSRNKKDSLLLIRNRKK